MSLSNPRLIFGVYSVSPYNRTTGEPYGIAKVIGEASMALSGELVKLMGGASKYPWAIEDGAINSEVSMKLKEYPDFLFQLFLGKAPTTAGADSSGACSTLTNKKGSSVMHASTGIATATVKAAAKADLKFTKYVVKATDATHVDVYAMTDIDFKRGTDKSFETDLLKITASPLTITASTPTEIPGFGIELNGGSGTIGMTADDTATFEVKPPSSKSMEVTIGATNDVYPEFGLVCMGQQMSDGSMVEIEIYRAKGIGAPIGLAEKAFSEAEIKVESFYDSAKDAIAKIRHIIPS